MGKVKISLTIEDEIYESFKRYCQQNGMKVSTKVELMMRETMKDTTLNRFL